MAMIDVAPLIAKFLDGADSKALRGASRVMAEDPRSLPERLLEMTRRANATRHRALIAEGRCDDMHQWLTETTQRADFWRRRAGVLDQVIEGLEAERGESDAEAEENDEAEEADAEENDEAENDEAEVRDYSCSVCGNSDGSVNRFSVAPDNRIMCVPCHDAHPSAPEVTGFFQM